MYAHRTLDEMVKNLIDLQRIVHSIWHPDRNPNNLRGVHEEKIPVEIEMCIKIGKNSNQQ